MENCQIDDLGDRLVVTNDNPKRRNALTPGFQAGLSQALATANAERRIAAVILTGAEGFFCAGGDLNVLMTAHTLSDDGRRARIRDLAQLMQSIMDCRVPVIAAVEGGAAGAGLSLMMACDLVVAASDAQFTAAYVNAGLIPDGGLSGTLSAALPRPLVAEMLLLGWPVGAERFFDLGAINRLATPGDALDSANQLADRLAQGPADAQAAIKTLSTTAHRAMIQAQFDAEVPLMAAALAGPEAAEGAAAFLAKRQPEFARLRNS